MFNNGAVAIGFPFVKIENEEAMEAIIVAIAGIAQVNSLILENTYIETWYSYVKSEAHKHSENITMIPALILTEYLEQTENSGIPSQNQSHAGFDPHVPETLELIQDHLD
jgi:hypothetical protein